MACLLKPGDRVRSKTTGMMGTVIRMGACDASGPAHAETSVTVEWDGREGLRGAAAEDLHAIRPPPTPWPAPALPSFPPAPHWTCGTDVPSGWYVATSRD